MPLKSIWAPRLTFTEDAGHSASNWMSPSSKKGLPSWVLGWGRKEAGIMIGTRRHAFPLSIFPPP